MDANPDPGTFPALTVIIFFLTVLINALLTAADKSIECVNRNDIREKAADGDKKAGRLVRIFENQERFDSAVTVATVFMMFLASAVVIQTPAFSMRGLFRGMEYGYLIADVLLAIIASCVYLVLGMIYPRQIALKHPEGVALKMSGVAVFFKGLCRPFAAVARGLALILLKITRQGGLVPDEKFSEEEVMSMLEVGREQGDIDEEGTKMINSIFEFDDKLAYEIMTPRTDVFAIDIEDDPEDYMEQMMTMRYSRIPVYRGDMDMIIGILNIKDYLYHAYKEGFENVKIEEFLRDAVFVPETKNIDSLFREMQTVSQHIVVLIDEYGGVSGIVTIEDIIEEFVGDIDDEYDEEETEIETIDQNNFIVSGMMDIDDFNNEIGTHLESENNETISGLIIDELGEIPEEGVSSNRVVEIDNCRFTILSVRDRRIQKVRVEILEPEDGEEEGGEEK